MHTSKTLALKSSSLLYKLSRNKKWDHCNLVLNIQYVELKVHDLGLKFTYSHVCLFYLDWGFRIIVHIWICSTIWTDLKPYDRGNADVKTVTDTGTRRLLDYHSTNTEMQLYAAGCWFHLRRGWQGFGRSRSWYNIVGAFPSYGLKWFLVGLLISLLKLVGNAEDFKCTSDTRNTCESRYCREEQWTGWKIIK